MPLMQHPISCTGHERLLSAKVSTNPVYGSDADFPAYLADAAFGPPKPLQPPAQRCTETPSLIDAPGPAYSALLGMTPKMYDNHLFYVHRGVS